MFGFAVCFLHALHDPVGAVWAGLGGLAASPHEVCSSSVLGVVDGVADLACYVAKVSGVALLGLGFAASFDDPEKGEGGECTDYDAGKETSGEGAAVKV